jgi:ABC-2 type transport system ATP-binding protein
VVKDRQRLKELIGVLYDRLSATSNLRFSCWLYNLSLSRINEVLELVHLTERSNNPLRTFSNGMKQRLMIARALLYDPPVLFLDKPTRGLDLISAREVRLAIKQLSENGKTILLTTHLLEEADQLCGRVASLSTATSSQMTRLKI